ELADGMRRHPECALGASRMMYWDERDVFCNAGDRFHPWGAGGARGEGEPDRGQYDAEVEPFGVCAGAAIYRRSLFAAIGFFDEDFHSLAEDVDLNVRARLAGHKAVYLPRARVYHIGSATLGRYSRRYVYLAHRNEWFVMLKTLPLGLWCKHLGAIVRHHIRTAQYFAYRGQGGVLLKAKWDAARRLPSMLRKRAVIQQRRAVADDVLERSMST
ncbi:MAG: glycosyltransferase family 2 protein, partial [Nitrospinaceae bacterium]